MKRHTAQAFSLIELMVVLAIVVILLLLLVAPLLDRAVRTSYIASCGSNIAQVYKAAQTYRTDKGQPLSAIRWQPNLLPYFQNNRQIFFCPEDKSPFADALQSVNVSIDVFDPCTGGGVFRGNLPLYEWSRPVGFGGGSQGWRRKDVRPGVYQLWMEDGWNRTWNDLILEIDETNRGQIKVSYIGENTGGGRCGGWIYTTLDAQGQPLPPLHDMGKSPATSGSKFGDSLTIYADEGEGSYGMNLAHQPGFSGIDEGKWIMFTDYYKLQVDVASDDWAAELSSSGHHHFARHLNGICNVVTMDGSVRQRNSFEMDPTFVENIYRYWEPAD